MDENRSGETPPSAAETPPLPKTGKPGKPDFQTGKRSVRRICRSL